MLDHSYRTPLLVLRLCNGGIEFFTVLGRSIMEAKKQGENHHFCGCLYNLRGPKADGEIFSISPKSEKCISRIAVEYGDRRSGRFNESIRVCLSHFAYTAIMNVKGGRAMTLQLAIKAGGGDRSLIT
jgi:hypothetical protein